MVGISAFGNFKERGPTEEREGEGKRHHLQRRPTVHPAAIEGTEPVLTNPIVPPPAVRLPNTYATLLRLWTWY